jgi:hypothetical protein
MAKLQALGIDGPIEGAMFNLLGMDNPNYLMASMKCDERIQSYIKANGYSERVNYCGLIFDIMAEVFASGVECGRRLERSPVIDALYTGSGAAETR